MASMQVVSSGKHFPEQFQKSIYLIGPSPLSVDVQSWRPRALEILEAHEYDGVVYVPEPFVQGQREWELAALNRTDCAMVWLPRDMATLPGLTTNVEFGALYRTGKVVLGAPEEAPHMGYLFSHADDEYIPQAHTLEKTIDLALTFVGAGYERNGGECEVPLHIWRTRYFQEWYTALKSAGNRLDGAKLEWVFRVGQKKVFPLFFALHVNIWVEKEKRHKSNEVVISRPSISAVVIYQKGTTLMDTKLILVREFRSTATTSDGYIRENSGGSSFNPNADPLEVAAKETLQETGLRIEPGRFCAHGTRQVSGTVTTHAAHVFSVEITNEEMAFVHNTANERMGVSSETEQTYRDVMTLRDVLAENGCGVDWSTLGMISHVVLT